VKLDYGYSANIEFRRGPGGDAPIVIRQFVLRKHIGQASDGEYQVQIQTTFSMRSDETVVLGTSEFGGQGEAVVALLTAVE
jgi:hypothetical protein